MEKKLLGVCSWLSFKTGFDVTWVRVAFVVATIIGFGAPIFIYLVLFLLLEMGWIK